MTGWALPATDDRVIRPAVVGLLKLFETMRLRSALKNYSGVLESTVSKVTITGRDDPFLVTEPADGRSNAGSGRPVFG